MANKLPSEETKRADNNACKTVAAVRHLHRLLAVAADPKFCGTIAVEINAKNGHLGRPKATLIAFDSETEDA